MRVAKSNKKQSLHIHYTPAEGLQNGALRVKERWEGEGKKGITYPPLS